MVEEAVNPAIAPSPVEPVKGLETTCYVHSQIPVGDVAAFVAGEKIPSSDFSIHCKRV